MKCGVFILHLCMWFYLKQCRWWHVAQELSAVTLVCCLCFTTVHACATFFIHLFSWFHFVCACLFHCALHTVWTELRFTLVTTAVFTWEQNKTKQKNLLVTESQRKLCAHVSTAYFTCISRLHVTSLPGCYVMTPIPTHIRSSCLCSSP